MITIPGQRALDNRVLEKCGDARRFASLNPAFTDWVERGADAPEGVVTPVEENVAAYLGTAASVGRRYGKAVGIVAGLIFDVLLLTATWLSFR